MKPQTIFLSVEPKARFLANETQAKQWNLMAESAVFAGALETALLEFTRAQSPEANAVAMAYKIKGANEFAFHLLNIGIPRVSPNREDSLALKEHDIGATKQWNFDPSLNPKPKT